MELLTKFIEGTNEQYSIRNDGVVIKHWKVNYDINLKKNVIIYKEHMPTISICKATNVATVYAKINEKRKHISVRQAVAIAFNLPNPYVTTGTAIVIGHKDNNPLNCSIDNLYYKGRKNVTLCTSIEEKEEVRRIKNCGYKAKSYAKLTKEQRITRQKYQEKWEKENSTEISRMKKKSNARVIQDLDKSYVAAKLKLPVSILSNELYENYKATLQVKRLLAKKLNCSIQTLR